MAQRISTHPYIILSQTIPATGTNCVNHECKWMVKAYNEFNNILQNSINTYAPLKLATKSKNKCINQPWITKGLFKLSRKVNQKFSGMYK